MAAVAAGVLTLAAAAAGARMSAAAPSAAVAPLALRAPAVAPPVLGALAAAPSGAPLAVAPAGALSSGVAAVEAAVPAAGYFSELAAWVAPPALEPAGNGTQSCNSGSPSAIKPRLTRPKLSAGNARAIDQRRELGPGDVGMHFVARARCAEAAIGAGDDALAADDAGEAQDALRHQFRMLDEMNAVRHHAGDETLAVR